MCFFKKKKKVKIETKFHEQDPVIFRYKGEICFGWVYRIYPKENEETIYDIQVGGQCPAILNGIKESELRARKD